MTETFWVRGSTPLWEAAIYDSHPDAVFGRPLLKMNLESRLYTKQQPKTAPIPWFDSPLLSIGPPVALRSACPLQQTLGIDFNPLQGAKMSFRLFTQTCLTLVTVLSTLSLSAKPADLSKKRIEQAHVAVLISQKLQKDRKFAEASASGNVLGLIGKMAHGHGRPDCDEGDGAEKTSCMDAVCDKMPKYNCDDASELQRVGQMCRGVGGDCVTEMCTRLPSYACDDLSELETIAGICKRNHGTCVKEVCDKMPTYSCDDVSELKQVGETCRGVPSGCVASVCKRLASYECDDLSELKRIAETCKGN